MPPLPFGFFLLLTASEWWLWLRDSIPEDQAWMVLRIVVAGLLGGVVGWERELQKKSAGIRTHILVAVAAGLFASVTMLMAEASGDGTDALRTVNAVATGIGFLGAGLIFVDRSHNHVFGLTTAASVWATSAIGLTAGFGYFFLASSATIIVWSVLKFLNWITPEAALTQSHAAEDQTAESQTTENQTTENHSPEKPAAAGESREDRTSGEADI
ncbi:MgtC/SapB family protein [Candidatus Laterigemmans baculatus]|uniref:MgtC/SapB family protein n=1 Tax=Candidatus Laterigemmans baculatus TaxID=2770505 RepID=UPI0013DC4802|nr:MgtC/SapB family protein [Candidatus Laterigemmans baculatus]